MQTNSLIVRWSQIDADTGLHHAVHFPPQPYIPTELMLSALADYPIGSRCVTSTGCKTHTLHKTMTWWTDGAHKISVAAHPLCNVIWSVVPPCLLAASPTMAAKSAWLEPAAASQLFICCVGLRERAGAPLPTLMIMAMVRDAQLLAAKPAKAHVSAASLRVSANLLNDAVNGVAILHAQLRTGCNAEHFSGWVLRCCVVFQMRVSCCAMSVTVM